MRGWRGCSRILNPNFTSLCYFCPVFIVIMEKSLTNTCNFNQVVRKAAVVKRWRLFSAAGRTLSGIFSYRFSFLVSADMTSDASVGLWEKNMQPVTGKAFILCIPPPGCHPGENTKPQHCALRNSTGHFCPIRCLITYRSKVFCLLSKKSHPVFQSVEPWGPVTLRQQEHGFK